MKDIQKVLQIKKIKSLLYSLITLSGFTSERYPSPRLCARDHTSRLQRWRVVGNVREIWSARTRTSRTRSERLTTCAVVLSGRWKYCKYLNFWHHFLPNKRI